MQNEQHGPGRKTKTQDGVVATLGPMHAEPWWWKHLENDGRRCALDYERLTFRGKYSQSISTLELPLVMVMVLWRLIRWKRRYRYVFTFECDLVGLSIAFWQSILRMRGPKHVILQFIMREKENTLRSRVKYAVMAFLFGSVHRIVVSSRREGDYYRSVFGWPNEKVAFVPLHTAPELIERHGFDDGTFFLSAGRSFRDYESLVRAAIDVGIELVIVGGKGVSDRYKGFHNIRILEDIDPDALETLMLKSAAVVVPLEDRKISIGQSVILQAMALGKAVIATRTAGTEDYVVDMRTGILVSPGSVDELAKALRQLCNDDALRACLGSNARKQVSRAHLPHHYSRRVKAVVTNDITHSS